MTSTTRPGLRSNSTAAATAAAQCAIHVSGSAVLWSSPYLNSKFTVVAPSWFTLGADPASVGPAGPLGTAFFDATHVRGLKRNHRPHVSPVPWRRAPTAA